MKLTNLSILILSLFVLTSGCGKKEEVKPTESPKVKEEKTEVKKEYDPMEDPSFSNVMKVLREALDKEKTSQDSATKLNTAKAYILVIKFLNTDKERVKKAGMTEEDIIILKNDSKENATIRLKEIISSQTAPENIKKEAEAKLRELSSL